MRPPPAHAILHIHVRDEEGRPSTELKHYRQVCELIRKKNTDVIFNLTTGPGCNWHQSDDDPKMPGPGTMMFTAERRIEHICRSYARRSARSTSARCRFSVMSRSTPTR